MIGRLTAEIDGVREFDRKFTRFTEQLDDYRQIWPGVTIDLRNIVREQFAGRGVGSIKWSALSPGYQAWKERRFPGRPLLVRTGATLAALTGNTSRTVLRAEATSLTFGTSLPYPIFHQRGTRRMPRRPIFDLNSGQRIRLMKTIQRRLTSQFRNQGVTLS